MRGLFPALPRHQAIIWALAIVLAGLVIILGAALTGGDPDDGTASVNLGP